MKITHMLSKIFIREEDAIAYSDKINADGYTTHYGQLSESDGRFIYKNGRKVEIDKPKKITWGVIDDTPEKDKKRIILRKKIERVKNGI